MPKVKPSIAKTFDFFTKCNLDIAKYRVLKLQEKKAQPLPTEGAAAPIS